MKAAEMPCRMHADEECASRKGKNITDRFQVKIADAHYEKVAGHNVEESPQNIHCRRRKAFPGRFCEGSLEGPSHGAAYNMRNGVGQENSPKEVRHEMKPNHGCELRAAGSNIVSWAGERTSLISDES